jgi:hypothetical protein
MGTHDDELDDDRSLKPAVDPDLVYGAGAGSRSVHADDDPLKVWRFQQDKLIPDVLPTIDKRKFDYTPWESQYMWDEAFAPVIDESNRVVAHVGYVYVSDIWISLEDRRALGKPDREPPTLIGWDEEQAYAEVASQLNKDIESGVRVYVDDGTSIDKNRFIIWFHDTMPNYGKTASAVIVNPNGQIIKILEVTHIKISRWQRALQGLITALDVLAVIDLVGLVVELALIPVARIGALGLREGGRRIWGLVLKTLRREGKELESPVLTRLRKTALDLQNKHPGRAYEVLSSPKRFRHTLTADVKPASYAHIEREGSLRFSTGANAHYGEGVYAWEAGKQGVGTYIDIEVPAGTGVETLDVGGSRWVRMVPPSGDRLAVKIVGTNLTAEQIEFGRRLAAPFEDE